MPEALDFLNTLSASAPDDLFGYLWTIGPNGAKRTLWYPLGDEMSAPAERAVALSDEGHNVYWGVSAAAAAGTPHQRVQAKGSAGIFALWAEVDWGDSEAHQKTALPPTSEDAMSVLAATGLEPTIIINSGHGLHAWWVLGDFWRFENELERSRAAGLELAWQTTVKARAAERGWVVDSVFDLARVLRVPGTKNFKGTPAAVEIVSIEPGRSFDAGDFHEYLVEAPKPRRQTNLAYSPDFVIDPDAEPIPEMIEMMRVEHPRFGPVLDATEKVGDGSPSAYDLSLSTMCSNAGWNVDQQIVDLLVWNRVRFGHDLKRPDYYTRTLRMARSEAQTAEKVEALVGLEDQLVEAIENGDPEDVTDGRRQVAGALSGLLGFDLIGAIRYVKEPYEFAVELPGGAKLHIGPWDNVSAQQRFRDLIEASDVAERVPTFKAEEWRQNAHTLRTLCTDQDVGVEGTEVGLMLVRLEEYLFDREPLSDLTEAIMSQHPFTDPSTSLTGIFLPPFKRWLATMHNDRHNEAHQARVLRSAGALPFRVEVTLDRRSKASPAWLLPRGF